MWTKNDARDAADLSGPEVLAVRVNTHPGYSNRATIEVLVDRLPGSRDFLPEKTYEIDAGVMHVRYGTGGGACAEYWYTQNDERTHEQGYRRSSRAGAVNRILEQYGDMSHLLVDVVYFTGTWRHSATVGAVLASKVAKLLPEGWILCEVEDGLDLRFDPIRLDGSCVKCYDLSEENRVKCLGCKGTGIEWSV